MKLIVAIAQDFIVADITRALSKEKFPVTKLASSGGFLKSGNTTLLIGVQNEIVDSVIKNIKEVCDRKSDKDADKKVAKVNIFVLDMEQYRKI